MTTLAEAVWPALLRGELDTAVFVAFRMIEEAVREAGTYDLMRRAADDVRVIGSLPQKQAAVH